MREILLIFEGDESNEQRTADLIQEAILRVMDQEKMNIRNFVNTTMKPAPTVPVRAGGIMKVPDFMKKCKNKCTV